MPRQCYGLVVGLYTVFASIAAWAGSVPVTANIAFAMPTTISTQSDPQLRNPITINSFGQMYIAADGYGLARLGESDDGGGFAPFETSNFLAGGVLVNNPLSQTLNFFSDNYRANGNVKPIKATCAVNGARGGDCDKLYDLFNDRKVKLRLGMRALVTGGLSKLAATYPAFDLLVVYQ